MRKGNTSGKREDHVHDYLVESILVTLFCCQPFGIVAMIICHAGKVVSLGRIS
ncbi:MAG: CD225/dispanin family protein [Deltaproteobacteria bacterium]|uniref:CD225/dispanin family protein n=1 Tax=Candidatus Zymogenus saltonus TaxID=2844893 RepID=A0A9D8KC35_9DELT|nr:CD225/dispanin family protein [Candidatus Zymogenus saltonus]